MKIASSSTRLQNSTTRTRASGQPLRAHCSNRCTTELTAGISAVRFTAMAGTEESAMPASLASAAASAGRAAPGDRPGSTTAVSKQVRDRRSKMIQTGQSHRLESHRTQKSQRLFPFIFQNGRETDLSHGTQKKE